MSKLAETRRPMSSAVAGAGKVTFSRQNELPKLPLPTLEQTVEKYLKTIEPYAANPAELEAAKKAAKEFLQDPEMRRRQQALESLRGESVSYMERMWLDIGYHQWRAPLPINSNVTGYLIGQHRKQWPQSWSAAALSVGALNYHVQLKEEKVPVTLARDKPQCMDQYRRIFCLNRVPGEVQDRFERYPDSQHIVAIVGRRLYSIKVLGNNNEIIPLSVLHRHVQTIIDDAKKRGNDPYPVAALTGAERTTWSKARERLQKLNASSLKQVESAIFGLSLDFKVDTTDSEVASGTLVGDGRGFWFDKSVTISIKGDGNPAVHIEHSPYDAPVPLDMFFNHALPWAEKEYAKGVQSPTGSVPSEWPAPSEIKFELSDEIKADIRAAEAFTDAAIVDSDTEVVNCVGLGKAVWKQAAISPDAAVQMALQLAWRRMHGGNLPVATYETIGMTNYAHGRTECCRVVSSKSEAFVQSMLHGYLRSRGEAERKQAEKALREACDGHIQYISEGQQGKGIDRHMLALRLQSKDGSQPALFKDPLFARSGSTGAFYLSTSNNSYINRPFGGMFGSGMPDGYGVCYIPRDDGVLVCVESKRSCPTTDSLRFCKMVNECLMDIAQVAGVAIPRSML